MTEVMRQAVITLIFKDRGEESNWKNYRPISVTATEYRILGRVIHLALRPMMRRLIGHAQTSSIPGRMIDDNILSLTELARF